MPEFSYIARTQEGVRKEDIISATNIKEASALLVAENLSIVKITERDTSFDFFKPFIERLALEFVKFKNRVPIGILVFLDFS